MVMGPLCGIKQRGGGPMEVCIPLGGTAFGPPNEGFWGLDARAIRAELPQCLEFGPRHKR